MCFISSIIIISIYDTVAEQAVNLPQVNRELQDQRAMDRQGKLQKYFVIHTRSVCMPCITERMSLYNM